MDHAEHVALIRVGVSGGGALWADFGSGSGAFTLALAEVLGPSGMIYSLDRDSRALREQAGRFARSFPGYAVHYLTADYRRPLDLPAFDGIVMANTLHYLNDAELVPTLHRVRGYLHPAGRLVIVDYDRRERTYWLPHPLPWSRWQQIAPLAGFSAPIRIATRPSRHSGGFYAAVCINSLVAADR